MSNKILPLSAARFGGKVLAALLAATFAAPPSPARRQQPPPPPAQTPSAAAQDKEEVLRVGTAVVQVDVIVTDKSGRRVTGLSASDFVVADEGAPQTVDFFAAVEGSRVARRESPAGRAAAAGSGAPTGAPTTPLASPFPGRYIALVVDDQGLSHENLSFSRRALTEYVKTKLAPTDMVALIATGGSFASLQQFTGDRQRLLAAINRVAAMNSAGRQADPRYKLTATEALRIEAGDDDVLEAVARRVATQSIANEDTTGSLAIGMARPRGRAEGDAAGSLKSENPSGSQLQAQIRSLARARAGEIAAEARRTLKTLAGLFDAMAELPGRKVAVLLTESFSTLGNSSEDLSNELAQIVERARRAGVSVYGLDAGGLRTNQTVASEHLTGEALRARELSGSKTAFSDFENLGALRALVSGTGGELFANTNDITSGIERAVEDASSYYVVGFRPAKLDNRFHRLTVAVRGRPDLTVRTRRGYLAVNEETARGTNTELAAALLSPIPRTDLPLEVVVNVVPQGGQQVTLAGLHVGRNYLTLPAAGAAEQTAAYDVLAWVFAAGREQPAGAVRRTVTYDLAKEPQERQKLSSAGFVFVPQPFALPPGLYQIRAVVREHSSGALGSAYQFFEVPDAQNAKAVSLSSLILTEAGRTGFDGVNSFKPGSEMDVRYVVYNPPKNVAELEQRVQLTDSRGVPLMDSPLPLAPAADQKTAAQGTRLKVPPRRGRYSLIVTLKDRRGRVDLERRADFVVE
jgi:VWFA-related protein